MKQLNIQSKTKSQIVLFLLVPGAVITAAMMASFCALADDCSVHWLGPFSMLVVGLAFCGMQLGSGSLVAHIDLASRHAAVISGLTSTVGATAYFAIPPFTRLLVADHRNAMAMTSAHQTPTAPPIIPVRFCLAPDVRH